MNFIKDNFQLYFQPIMSLADLDLTDLPTEGDLCKYLSDQHDHFCQTYEVLLRLHNSHGEPISPNAFLPTAERFNLMRDIADNSLAQTQATLSFEHGYPPMAPSAGNDGLLALYSAISVANLAAC